MKKIIMAGLVIAGLVFCKIGQAEEGSIRQELSIINTLQEEMREETGITEESEAKKKTGREWTKTQKVLLGTYLLSETIDYFQTREILSNEKFYEKNPFIADVESCNVVFLAGTGITVLTAHLFPKWRTGILTVANIIEWSFVGHNHKIGIRIGF